MSTVVLDVAMSLDGFTAGPNIGEAHPLGEGGDRLHEWMWATDGPDAEIDKDFSPMGATMGAALVGRRTFDLGVSNWGGTPWPGVPTFVVTHRTRPDLLGDNGGTFTFDGLEAATRRAKETAGDQDVVVMGAHLAGALLEAGLLDEVRIHLTPALLGTGTPLFAGQTGELIPVGKPVTGAVTHLHYRVAKH